MTHSVSEYSIATVRELLLAAFSAEELRRFCHDRPSFRPVVTRFGPGQGLDDMVEEVITYCETRLLWDELLAEVQRANPRQYERFAPKLIVAPPVRVASAPREPGAFPALTNAARAGGLLLLWGLLPFPLVNEPPESPALALEGLSPMPDLPEQWAEWLTGLPPLPILSLDSSDRLGRAFDAAGVRLCKVLTTQDVLGQHQHCLVGLAGDQESRTGLVFSRAEVLALLEDPDKRYLLDEARRVATDGALLLLGCDPADVDFRTWWALLAAQFRGATFLAVGEPSAPWPQGVTCLGPDLDAIRSALEAALVGS